MLAHGAAGGLHHRESGRCSSTGVGTQIGHHIRVGDHDGVGGEAQPAGGQSLLQDRVGDARHDRLPFRSPAIRSASTSSPVTVRPAVAAAAASESPT